MGTPEKGFLRHQVFFWIEQRVTRQREFIIKRDKKRKTKLKMQPRDW